jgi:NAD(P)-dependent dehydrogenase (short-subunit alcohol dehydrogenase family)
VASEFVGLDLLVSKAGVEHFGALQTITQADFDRLSQTNVAGQLFVTQAAVAAMTDGGRIVPRSSVSVRLAVWASEPSPSTRSPGAPGRDGRAVHRAGLPAAGHRTGRRVHRRGR